MGTGHNSLNSCSGLAKKVSIWLYDSQFSKYSNCERLFSKLVPKFQHGHVNHMLQSHAALLYLLLCCTSLVYSTHLIWTIQLVDSKNFSVEPVEFWGISDRADACLWTKFHYNGLRTTIGDLFTSRCSFVGHWSHILKPKWVAIGILVIFWRILSPNIFPKMHHGSEISARYDDSVVSLDI